jgi:hypothetical protein
VLGCSVGVTFIMLTIFLLSFIAVLAVALFVVLILKYLRTRDVGFVWLGVAVVIWPIVSNLLNRGERIGIDRVTSGRSVGIFPFTLIERGETSIGNFVSTLALLHFLVGIALLFIAVFYLCRTKRKSTLPDVA